MKIDPTDSPLTPRDGDDGADANELEELVRSTRGRRPSPDAVQRIAKRLVAAGALDPASLSESAPPGGRPTTARVANKVGYYYKAGAVALAVAAGSLLAWRATSTSTPADTAAVVAGTTGSTKPEAVGSSGDSPAAGERGAAEASGAKRVGGEVPAVSIDALPTAAPKPRAVASDSANRGTPERGSANTAAPELLLVRRAQDALATDPARALSLADEHAGLFPRGELTQEREVVAVEALSKLGRKHDALVRARALLRRFPRTPYVAHLEKALGEPLTAPSNRDDAANSDSNSRP